MEKILFLTHLDRKLLCVLASELYSTLLSRLKVRRIFFFKFDSSLLQCIKCQWLIDGNFFCWKKKKIFLPSTIGQEPVKWVKMIIFWERIVQNRCRWHWYRRCISAFLSRIFSQSRICHIFGGFSFSFFFIFTFFWHFINLCTSSIQFNEIFGIFS